jgi:alpha/beta superfamily hydrolase
VQGTLDDHGAWEKVEQIVARIPGGTRLVFVQDADHFFAGHLEELDRAICDWVTEHHPELHKL